MKDDDIPKNSKNLLGQHELLTRKEVLAVCRIGTALYRWLRTGEFPLPITVGPPAVRWRTSEVNDWLANRPRATGNRCEA